MINFPYFFQHTTPLFLPQFTKVMHQNVSWEYCQLIHKKYLPSFPATGNPRNSFLEFPKNWWAYCPPPVWNMVKAKYIEYRCVVFTNDLFSDPTSSILKWQICELQLELSFHYFKKNDFFFVLPKPNTINKCFYHFAQVVLCVIMK